MSDANPFDFLESAPGSLTSGEPANPSSDGISRDGKLLMVRKNAHQPERCIVCNAPSDDRRTFQFSKSNFNSILLTVLGSFGATAAKELYVIRAGICRRHERLANIRTWVCGSLWVLAIALCVFSDKVGLPEPAPAVLAVAGLVLIVVALLAGSRSRLVKLARAEASHLWLRVGPDYLGSFPERIRPRGKR